MESPNSKSMIITANCSLAKPPNISEGVKIPKTPRAMTAMKKVNAAPINSLYKEIRMKAITTKTIMTSKCCIG